MAWPGYKYSKKIRGGHLPPVIECSCCHHLNVTTKPGHAPAACSCCGSCLSKTVRAVPDDDLPPRNPDGTVTLYHGTTAARAANILREGKLRPGPEGAAFLTTTPSAIGYGDVVLRLRLKTVRMYLDDEFPDGRRDYRVEPAFPGGTIPVVVEL